MVWDITKNRSLSRCNLKRQNEGEYCELLLLSLYDDCVGEFTVLARLGIEIGERIRERN